MRNYAIFKKLLNLIIMEKVNISLKKLREKYSLSQLDFAVEVGVYQHQVSQWENGIIKLSDKRLLLFDKILKDKFKE